jgi:GAF domain-containing protein
MEWLGLVVLLVGAALMAAAWWAVRALRQPTPTTQPNTPPPSQMITGGGLIVARPGGQIVHVDTDARALFGLNGGAPNLSKLAEHAEPATDFLSLFAGPASARLLVSGRAVNAASLRVPADEADERLIVSLRPADELLPATEATSVEVATTLANAVHRLLAEQEPDAVLDAIGAQSLRLFAAQVVSMRAWDNAGHLHTPRLWPPEASPPTAEPDAAHAVTREWRPITASGVLSLPLQHRQANFGVLSLVREHPFSPDEQHLLAAWTDTCAAHYAHTRQAHQARQQAAELSGLADIARALEAGDDPHALFTRLTADIARLMQVEMAGVLMHDPASEALIAQTPFFGIPDIVIDGYRITVGSNTPAARLWRDRPYLVSNDLPRAVPVSHIDLRHLAQTVGARATVLVPLMAAGRRVGVLQVVNRRDGTPFTPADADRLALVARQVGALLENTRLVREAQRRAHQAEVLGQLAAALASETTLLGVIDTALRESQRLLTFDFGALLVLDSTRGELEPYTAPAAQLSEHTFELLRFRATAPDWTELATLRRTTLAFDQALSDLPAAGPYRALLIDQQYESLLAAPLLAGDRSLGELVFASHAERGFSADDRQLITIIAAQVASALERTRLYSATDRDLQRRVEQLTALTHVSRALNGSLDLDRIVRLVHAEAQRATQADSVTITFLNPDEIEARLRLPTTPLDPGSALNVTVLEREALRSGRPVRSLDSADLCVPIVIDGAPAGVMRLHRSRPGGFDGSAEDILTALAAQTATAAANARRFADETRRGALMQQRAEQLSHLLGISRAVRADTELAANLQTIANGLHEAVGYGTVGVYVLEPSGQTAEQLAGVGLPHRGTNDRQPWYRADKLMREAFRISASYFLTAEHAADLTHPFTFGPASPHPAADGSDTRAWRRGDLLAVPMLGAGREVLGLITLANPADGLRPDVGAIEVAEIFANQAALAVENARLYQASQSRAAQLAALAEASREITAALRVDDVVRTLIDRLDEVLAHDSVTLWLRAGEELRVAAARGFENDAERVGLRVAIADSALFAEMARTSSAIIVRDVYLDARFPAGVFGPTRSWLAAPLVSKGRIIGAIALDKREPNSYSEVAVGLLTAFANQAATALDNARLFEENEQRRLEIDARSQRLALLNRISSAFSRTLDVYALYEALVSEMAAALDAPSLALFTLEAEAGALLAVQVPVGALPPAPLLEAFQRARETQAPVALEDVNAPLRGTGTISVASENARRRNVHSALVLPLIASGNAVAMLQVEETRGRRRFTPAEVELAQTMANQAAAALQNARLLIEVQSRAVELGERNERMAHLNRMANSLSATLDLDVILKQAAEQLVEIFTADHASLILFDDPGRIGLVEAEHPYHGALGQRLAVVSDFLAREVINRRTLVVEDIDTDARIGPELHANLTQVGARSALMAPLISQNKVVGFFTIESRTPRQFTADEVELAETVAAQIAAALTNAQFASDLETRVNQRTKEVQRERERVETLLQITTELSSSLELDRVLQRALQLVTEAVNATQGSIFLLDQITGQLIYRAALGSPKVLPPGGEPIPFRKGEGLVGWVVTNRQPVIIHNLDVDERWKHVIGQNVNHRSALAVPLIWNDEMLGAVLVYSPMVNAFDEDQLRLVSAAANQVGSAINNAELYRLIRDQAERLGVLLREQQVETTKSRAILEGIGDGVLVTDSGGRVTLFNEAAERILTLQRDVAVGKPVVALASVVGQAGRPWLEAATRAGMHAGSDVLAFPTLELLDKRIVTVSLAPVVDGEEFIGTVSLIRDVTRDVEVDRIKTEFVTNVSHELRTPITPIKGYADMLLMGAAGPVSDMQAKLIGVIKNNAERLHTLVNDLLDISRLESGRVKFTLGDVAVDDILQLLAEQLRARAATEAKPMTIATNLSALPTVRADKNRLTQMLANLADNAFSYTPAGGTVTFTAWHERDGNEVRIDVADTGVGLTPEHKQRLFERFLRGENPLVMAKAGTGLGLSIARQLIEIQGGRLWLAHSEEGKGSVFSVALPVAVDDES